MLYMRQKVLHLQLYVSCGYITFTMNFEILSFAHWESFTVTAHKVYNIVLYSFIMGILITVLYFLLFFFNNIQASRNYIFNLWKPFSMPVVYATILFHPPNQWAKLYMYIYSTDSPNVEVSAEVLPMAIWTTAIWRTWVASSHWPYLNCHNKRNTEL